MRGDLNFNLNDQKTFFTRAVYLVLKVELSLAQHPPNSCINANHMMNKPINISTHTPTHVLWTHYQMTKMDGSQCSR